MLALFLLRWMLLFACVQGFVGLVAMLRLLARHPYVSMITLTARLPDALLVFVPISLPFSVLIASLATVRELRRRRMLLQLAAAGSHPIAAFVPVTAFVLAACIGVAYVATAVIPQARYQLAGLAAAREAPQLLALRLAEDPELLPGFRVRFDGDGEGHMRNVRIVSRASQPATAIVARSALLRRVPDSPYIELVLSQGRLLRVTTEMQLETNLSFESLRLRRDARTLGGPEKTRLINLSYYTGDELDRLRPLLLHRFRRGVRPTPSQRLRVKGVQGERWTRLQSAFMSLLFVVLVFTLLTRTTQRHDRAHVVLVTLFCLVVLLPTQIILESAAARGRLATPWLGAAPSVLALLAIAVSAVVRHYRGKTTT